MKTLIVSLIVLISTIAKAEGPALESKTRAKLKKEIEYVGSLYGTVYAPKAWKEKHMGWDLPAQINLAQKKLAAAHDMHEARAAMANLIKSTADYHVSFSFYSTEKATLPFQVRTVEGKTLIVYIDRAKVSETAFPFSVGDEVLTLDQEPVAQILASIAKESGANTPETDAALADLSLTRRAGRLNQVVPHGPVTLTIKRAADDTVGSVQLAWDYTPERLNAGGEPFSLNREKSALFGKMMISQKARDLGAEDKSENPHSLGVRKPFLPDFGNRIWQTASTNTFDAYIFQDESGQLIGVVRIPEYMVPNDNYAKAVKDFAGIINHMEKNTSALVIDQNNNPGGSVFYLYSLVSMLSDQTMTVPKHRVSLVPSEAQECLKLLEALPSIQSDKDAVKVLGAMDGYPVTYQFAIAVGDYCSNLVKQFHAGKTLSEPLFLWGVDKINPNPIHYTKPLVLLINSLDFSGGDFFPAILQDNKRAKVVGVRTAGAGGYVNEAEFPNSFGLEKIRFTGSIAERVDLNPIENLGVTPDVELPMTVEDYRSDFKHYIKSVKSVIKAQTK